MKLFTCMEILPKLSIILLLFQSLGDFVVLNIEFALFVVSQELENPYRA